MERGRQTRGAEGPGARAEPKERWSTSELRVKEGRERGEKCDKRGWREAEAGRYERRMHTANDVAIALATCTRRGLVPGKSWQVRKQRS